MNAYDSSVVAAVAAAASALTAPFSARLAWLVWQWTKSSQSYEFRVSQRIEFQRMLLECSRCLVEHPELWALYRTNWPSVGYTPGQDASLDWRLKSFAYMHLNMFEIVCSYFMDNPEETIKEEESAVAWESYLRHCLDESPMMAEIVKSNNMKSVYGKKFVTYVRRLASGPSSPALWRL